MERIVPMCTEIDSADTRAGREIRVIGEGLFPFTPVKWRNRSGGFRRVTNALQTLP
jgi:hypothetical protein